MNHTDLQAFQTKSAALPRSTVLFHEPGIRGLLLHLNADEQIPEHSTPGSISVQCLQGDVIFAAGEEQITLSPGSLVSLAPAVPHRLAAQQDSLLLVTIREEIRNQPV
jgi:quercetin dioxygenase-like cupin family protein